jgi:hypothetical protein
MYCQPNGRVSLSLIFSSTANPAAALLTSLWRALGLTPVWNLSTPNKRICTHRATAVWWHDRAPPAERIGYLSTSMWSLVLHNRAGPLIYSSRGRPSGFRGSSLADDLVTGSPQSSYLSFHLKLAVRNCPRSYSVYFFFCDLTLIQSWNLFLYFDNFHEIVHVGMAHQRRRCCCSPQHWRGQITEWIHEQRC